MGTGVGEATEGEVGVEEEEGVLRAVAAGVEEQEGTSWDLVDLVDPDLYLDL